MGVSGIDVVSWHCQRTGDDDPWLLSNHLRKLGLDKGWRCLMVRSEGCYEIDDTGSVTALGPYGAIGSAEPFCLGAIAMYEEHFDLSKQHLCSEVIVARVMGVALKHQFNLRAPIDYLTLPNHESAT